MLKEAAVPNHGLGHGTVPKQPVASPMPDELSDFPNIFGCLGVGKKQMASPVLAMSDGFESNLGCSIALKTIKSTNQYQRNFDVPLASSEASGSEKNSRYYTIPAEPLDAQAQESWRSSSELQQLESGTGVKGAREAREE